ncbi:hypothetical protein NIASO_01975 [Niabella soli DSM 19437]|uniref:Uncharacterized protein n=1 Tax=Niabella soli DSM 19437 TaxID=929713 RepID=W0F6N0_9BACT|nr:hypothetical protein NIASO_01975 [Niabella soli DSM 19437]
MKQRQPFVTAILNRSQKKKTILKKLLPNYEKIVTKNNK